MEKLSSFTFLIDLNNILKCQIFQLFLIPGSCVVSCVCGGVHAGVFACVRMVCVCVWVGGYDI